MCGICGELSLSGAPVDPARLEPMLSRMAHRGPDASGSFHAPGIAAGIRRLAVIDLAGGGQPMSNEDGRVRVVFNGEIYNHRELRRRLEDEGHRFRSRSDTEVLVHLWERDGPGMLERLDGMFAFCLHDAARGEVLLARDRLGIKPLFLRRDGDRIVFASETGVLLAHPDPRPEVDREALLELFCLQYLAGDATVYRGVVELPAGHYLHLREGRETLARWWSVPRPEPVDRPKEELVEELRGLLGRAVRNRTLADVPLGVFLSGGLDSAIVTALLAEHSDAPPRTFSVGFEDDAAHDEREHARTVAEAFGCDHAELPVSPLQIAEQLPRLIEHLAEPVLDPAMLPTWTLSRFARERVTVVLTGEGADELFAGYRRYEYQNRFGWLSRIPALPGALRARLPRRIEQALEAVGEEGPALNHLRWSMTLGERVAAGLFHGEAYRVWLGDAARRFATYFDGREIRLGDQLFADQQEWLPHALLAKVDRASMAHSLEARVPFLDHRIVEFAAKVPERFKLHGGRSKLLLRSAFGERLPAGIVERPKRGFDLPLDRWIRGPLRDLARERLTPRGLRGWEQLDAVRVGAMLDDHLAQRQDFGLPLFSLLSLQIFLESRP